MNKDALNIFDVPLEGGTFSDVLAALDASHERPFWIVTANPENLLDGYRDPSYAEVLRRASWRTIDGFGIQLVSILRGYQTERLTGVDLAEGLLHEANRRGWSVAFFGGFEGSGALAAEEWKRRLPGLRVQAWSGGAVRLDGSEDGTTWEQREAMQAAKPDLVFVALGGGMKQERWISRHITSFAGARAVVGIGGAFDMWSGKLRRASVWLRKMGLEWMWRLWLEPRRIGRIWRAVVVFPWRAIQTMR